MTRKYGDELYRSPSTMASGHISSLPDGASRVDVPDLKRLGQEPGFYPVPRRTDGPKANQASSERQPVKDHLSVGAGSSQHAASSKQASKTGEQKGPLDRAMQMLKPSVFKKKQTDSK